MLDFELAEIYGYSTKRFNEQVRNNIEKFDSDFMFQLTKAEFQILMSKKSTSSWGGRRKLPKAFTEQRIFSALDDLNSEYEDNTGHRLHRTKYEDFLKEYPDV